VRRREFCQSALVAAGVMAFAPWQRAFAAETNALNIDGAELTLTPAQIEELGGALRGGLLLPGNAAYEQARLVLNPTIDKHPALIVQPTGVADVSLAVQFAQDNQLVTAIKCGGHSYSGRGTVNGGLLIDLSRFRHVRVNSNKRIAYVSGGSLLGAMDHEALAQGLVTTAGTVSHTGVGGLATAAGYGRLARKLGLAVDNIRAVDVVSADGRLRHASAQQNQDLYWAVRGAGSNFGVVTGFEFDLHPMSRMVLAADLIYPFARFRDVLEFYAEFSAAAPDELCVDLIAGFPPGNTEGFVYLAMCYSGNEAAGRRVIAAAEALGKPMRGGVRMVDYEALQRSGDNTAPRSKATYMKGGFTSEITTALIDDLVGGLAPAPGRSTMVIFQQAGGAIKRIAADATAFPHRYAEHNMMLTINWKPEIDARPHVAYLKNFWRTMVTYTHGFYTVEADDENAGAWSKNYQGNYDRLLGIKRQYDADNIFRLNANISPA